MEHVVWVFCGDKGRFPSGVFVTREQAEQWIGAHGLSGALTAYPLGEGVYDWAIANGCFNAKREDQRRPEFIQNFSSGSLEHYHYENGRTE
jgi:hypothetical protein